MRIRKNISKFSDAELIARYKQKSDKKCMGELYNRYAHLVFGVCLKYLKNQNAAQDAVMFIFEKLFVDLKEKEVKEFKPWLYVVTKNFCLMELRKTQTETNLNGHEPSCELPEIEIQKENQEEILIQAINNLKEHQKTCITLFYLEELSYQKIAEKTGCSLKEIKSHIQNGKRNLKIELSKKRGEKARA